jgi:hypothetical protein
MTKSLSRNEKHARPDAEEYFNLHASGCGYLSRIRWVEPNKRRGGRTGEQFLACAINALRGDVENPSYTYFDLRVSGEEAIDLIEQLKPAVDENRKVFIAFKLGDFYAHPYERDVRNGRGERTGEKEISALIKGRLLLITHVKVDGEVVYTRDEADRADSDERDDRRRAPPAKEPLDTGSRKQSMDRDEFSAEDSRAAGRHPEPARRRESAVKERMRVPGYREAAAA